MCNRRREKGAFQVYSQACASASEVLIFSVLFLAEYFIILFPVNLQGEGKKNVGADICKIALVWGRGGHRGGSAGARPDVTHGSGAWTQC